MLSRPRPPERSRPRHDRPSSPSRTTRRHHRRLSFSDPREQPDFEELQRQVMQETGLRLYGMKGQKKQELWQFVRLLAQDEAVNVADVNLTNAHARKAYCLKCRRNIDFRTGKHFVKQHMEVYHPADLERFTGVRLRSTNAPQNGSQNDAVDRDLRASFDEVADHEPARAVTQEQQKHVNKLLAKWVACHFRPMVIVEDEGFVELVRFITEDICRVKLELPERTQLRHEIVVLASDLRRRVQADIADGCMYFSITTDIWTARNARSYISLTVHYVDDDFHLKNWTLEVRELPGIHDGQAIADALAQMMEDWSLSKDFCTRILSDSASNVMKAAKKLGIEHMSCIAHTLHLIVSGAMVKAKARPTSDEFSRWAEGVESEISGAVPECEDDELLSNDDRTRMDGLREFAIDDINVYLDATISSPARMVAGSQDRVPDFKQTGTQVARSCGNKCSV